MLFVIFPIILVYSQLIELHFIYDYTNRVLGQVMNANENALDVVSCPNYQALLPLSDIYTKSTIYQPKRTQVYTRVIKYID